MKNILVGLVGAIAFAMLAALFSVRVFGINSGWMYVLFLIAAAILGARAAKAIYTRATKGK